MGRTLFPIFSICPSSGILQLMDIFMLCDVLLHCWSPDGTSIVQVWLYQSIPNDSEAGCSMGLDFYGKQKKTKKKFSTKVTKKDKRKFKPFLDTQTKIKKGSQ